MITVHEVSKLTGVSVRTLQYYDKIGLLHPAKYTDSGYRLYDDAALVKLQQILLFRELEFPLKDIKLIMDSPDFDYRKALEQQINLLTLKKEHLENLLNLARGIKAIGVNKMDFTAFDTKIVVDCDLSAVFINHAVGTVKIALQTAYAFVLINHGADIAPACVFRD